MVIAANLLVILWLGRSGHQDPVTERQQPSRSQAAEAAGTTVTTDRTRSPRHDP
jgi:hypothetical protein